MITIISKADRILLSRLTQATVVPHTRKRLKRSEMWPDVGKILQGNYLGEVFEAEIVPAKFKSGKALRLLTGKVQGTVVRSFSAAQELLTLASRKKAQIKGKKGLPNAWAWFSIKKY